MSNKTQDGKNVSDMFEQDFLKISLQKQITACEKYEIAHLFRKWLPDHQPVLEAGCGSGRWCAWFKSNGWESTGLDWSEALCVRARKEIEGVSFVSGDMQNTPFADCSYGAVVALGSVEHVTSGPGRALNEFLRILKPGGVAVVTVPHGGMLRRSIRLLTRPLLWLKSSQLIRKLLGKKGAHGVTLRQATSGCRWIWFPQYLCNDKGWHFFQYEFSDQQMRQFIKKAGFELEEAFVSFDKEGILHNFGRLAARWDEDDCRVILNPIGRLIRRVLPVKMYGHMLCYVIRRPVAY